MVEGARLEIVLRLIPVPGFESLTLRTKLLAEHLQGVFVCSSKHTQLTRRLVRLIGTSMIAKHEAAVQADIIPQGHHIARHSMEPHKKASNALALDNRTDVGEVLSENY